MTNNKLHTPDGVNDTLPKQCALKSAALSCISSVYKSYGYFEIQTPTYEYINVFSGSNKQELVKFIDTKGNILALRPDLTTGIARAAATKMSHQQFPLRVYYTGNAFAMSNAYQGALQNEFTQAGIECLGTTSLEADAEVIAATIEAVLSTGITDFQLEIGHADYFKGLMEQAGFNSEQTEDMRQLVDRKSFVGVAELVENCNIDDDLKNTILNLPNSFGGIDVIEKQKGVGEKAANALADIKKVYEIICDYGYQDFISIDLGMVQKLNYYTGIIVKGFAGGMGFPICGGGRYDNLIEEFGAKIPATGIAIGIERLLTLCENNQRTSAETIVVYDDGCRADAIKVSRALRSNGVITQLWVDNNDDACDYAIKHNVCGIVHVTKDGLVITNVETGEKSTASISDMIGGEE